MKHKFKLTPILVITLSYYLLHGIIHNLGHVVTPTFVNQLGLPSFMFGFFFSSMSLGMLVGAPLWGVLGDIKGKKFFILIGLILYSIAQVMFAFFTSPVMMTFARFLAGFGVSAFMTLMLSHLIGIAPLKERTKFISISVALFALGTTIGYQIGGFMGDFFIREVFYIQALLNLGWVLFIALSMKEIPTALSTKKPSFIKHFKDVTKLSPPLLLFLIGLTLATISASILSKYFDVYMIDLGYTPRELGTFILVTGFVGLFTNAFIVPKLSKLKKDMGIMLGIQIFSAIIVLIVFRSQYFIVMLYTVFLFYYALKAMFQPFEQNYISLQAPKEKHGSILGVRHAFFSTGMVIGPLISGFIYDYNPLLVFDLSVVMFLLAFVFLLIAHKLQTKASVAKESGNLGFAYEPVDITAKD